jgi:hypothetical protein
MEKVNYKRVAAVAIAVLTAISLVTGQAAEFIRKFVGLLFAAE